MDSTDTQEGTQGSFTTIDDAYEAIAARKAQARVLFSQEFQLAKSKATAKRPVTDREAEQIAIERTGDALTGIEAIMRIIEVKLENQR